ncbi:hypothetical protein JCM24511_06605 [Saitozyma sp. JCM 24511]|nr:hypothetical protein JCM24511_06605 [Saitozyma sp. JCM 24511]
MRTQISQSAPTPQNTLLVDMQFKPGWDELAMAIEEANVIKSLLNAQPLPRCHLAVFACHSEADKKDPSKSAILLGSLGSPAAQRLTVNTFLNTRMDACGLVYLKPSESGSTSGGGSRRSADDWEKGGVGSIPPAGRPVPDSTCADDVHSYPYDRGASTRPPRPHRPILLTSHLHQYSSSVHRQSKGSSARSTKRNKCVQSEGERGISLVARRTVDGKRGGRAGDPERGKEMSDKAREERGGVGNSSRKRPKGKAESQECDEEETGREKEYAEEEDMRELELHLFLKLMELMVSLETEARQMLIDSMEKGVVRSLLLADLNVQIRDVRALGGDKANILAIWRSDNLGTAPNSMPKSEDRSKNEPDRSHHCPTIGTSGKGSTRARRLNSRHGLMGCFNKSASTATHLPRISSSGPHYRIWKARSSTVLEDSLKFGEIGGGSRPLLAKTRSDGTP